MSEQIDELDFERLLSKLSEAEMTAEDNARLWRLIQAEPSLRRRYLEYCQMHAMLSAEHGLLSSWGEPATETSSVSRSPGSWTSRRRWFAAIGAVAALLAIAAVGLWRFAGEKSAIADERHPYRGDPVARLTKQVRAQFVYGPRGETTPDTGAMLPQGTYELTSGIIKIESKSGAELIIEAPASFTLADDPLDVTVTHDYADLDTAKAFAGSAELREAMQRAGVDGQPQIWFVNPA